MEQVLSPVPRPGLGSRAHITSLTMALQCRPVPRAQTREQSTEMLGVPELKAVHLDFRCGSRRCSSAQQGGTICMFSDKSLPLFASQPPICK